MRLSVALRCGSNPNLAFTGAGGKTTAMFRLARELPGPVLVSASTHLGEWQLGLADRHWVIQDPADVKQLVLALQDGEIGLVTGQPEADTQRVKGVSDDVLEALRQLADERGWPILLEADGSRQKPIKAPAAHEPLIPSWVDTVVVTAGLSGLGKVIDEEHVHRKEIFTSLAGAMPGDRITPDMLTRVLIHPNGGLKGVPSGARRVALLNQADGPELLAVGRDMAKSLLQQYDAVLVSTLLENEVSETQEPVGGIVLAAGAAQRYGQAKVLLSWHGQPFVRQVAQTALSAGLDPVCVVAGAYYEEIRDAVQGLPVQVIENPDWEMGQSSSLRAGLACLPGRCGAAAFLLADQPQIAAGPIQQLVDLHAATLAPIVAPRVDGRRANPVLFDRATFHELALLTGDTGGRELFARYPVQWMDSTDRRLLFDVDTPADYEALQGMETDSE